MRLITGGIVAVALLLGTSGLEAGWFSGKKLPKPIDFPVVRAKVKESHKPGNKQKHPRGHVQNVTHDEGVGRA